MKQKLSKNSSPTRPNVSAKQSELDTLLRNDVSLLDIPNECKKELDSKGLVARWVDIVELNKNQGTHKRGWAPYKFDCKLPGASNPFAVNAGQYDGYLMRRQLVLAVMLKEEQARNKTRVQLRTRMQADPAKLKKEEMKEYLRAGGLDSIVTGNEDMSDED